MQNTDGSWRITVDYQKLNQVVTLIAAAVPDIVVYVLDKLTYHIVPGMQLLIYQMPYSWYLSTRTTRNNLLLVDKASSILLQFASRPCVMT